LLIYGTRYQTLYANNINGSGDFFEAKKEQIWKQFPILTILTQIFSLTRKPQSVTIPCVESFHVPVAQLDRASDSDFYEID